jgi:hypothetical protein
MLEESMFEDEIRIRINGEEFAFTYSILRDGEIIETAEVEAEELVAPGYYCGSEALD